MLLNLVTNASQAMGVAGGRLVVEVETGSGDGPPMALLSVTDSGVGMSAETMRRLFEPFFTTKNVGFGTGLGLSIVHGIVRDHGGDVSVSSTQGQGSVFTVSLPLGSEQEAAPAPVAPVVKAPPTAALRVLCVDDEPAIVRVVVRALGQSGHTVTGASDPREALELFRRDPGSFDVILTDQTMPHMTGTGLIKEILALRPGMPCVLMTGLGDEDMQQRARALGIVEALPKPFLTTELQRAVERSARRDANRKP